MITDVAKIASLPKPAPAPDDKLREVAEQFEALLLKQLTSALAQTEGGDDGEEKLFGNDGGSGLAKQMFAEQMATTLAKAGGIGLADMLVEKMAGNRPADKPDVQKLATAPANAIKDIIRDAVPAAPKPESGSFEPIEAKPVSERRQIDAAPTVGDGRAMSAGSVSFSMPAKGRISSSFGTRFHPIDGRAKFHGGIDIAIPKGTPVRAAADGVVKFAGWKGGYGYAVVISHPDGTETLYGHNDKLVVQEGQAVRAGEQITFSGSTGKSTGPHLHFELRANGKLVDPMKLLSNVFPKASR